MHRSLKLATTLGVVALLAVPSAFASWKGFGTWEPDNAQDSPFFMQFEDSPRTGLPIYFNAFQGPLGQSINNGVTQSNFNPLGQESYVAILGVWRDCNGDGYIGSSELGLREYPSQALLDTTACPSTPQQGGTTSWPMWAFNYRGIVSEFIPIGNQFANTNPQTGAEQMRNSRLIRDASAMVWGDEGLHNSPAAVSGGTCALGVIPRGTFRTTGGVLDYVSCIGNLAARWNCVLTDDGETFPGAAGVACPGVDPNNAQGLRFADEENLFPEASGGTNDCGTAQACGGHPLFFGLFGSESKEHSAIEAQDCNSPALVTTGNVPVGGSTEPGAGVVPDLDNRGIGHSPGQLNGDPTTWTVPGTMNTTVEGLDLRAAGIKEADDDGTNADDGRIPPSGDCNYSNDRGASFYGNLEGDNEGTRPSGKRSAFMTFNFSQTDRGTQPPESVIAGGRSGMSDDDGFGLGSAWFGDGGVAGRRPLLTKGDATAGTLDLPDARYFTYYASVSSATTGTGATLPSATFGTYGGPQCGGATSGIVNGWNCNANEWYVSDGGVPDPERYRFGKVGQTYNLRDVDCHDDSPTYDVAGTGLLVPAGPASLGTNPCQH